MSLAEDDRKTKSNVKQYYGEIIWQHGMTLEALNQLVILQCYRINGKNKAATARSLGIDIKTLNSKLEKYEDDISMEEINAEADKQRKQEWLDKCRGIKRDLSDGDSTNFEIGAEAKSRLRLESPKNPSTKQPVPVSKRS